MRTMFLLVLLLPLTAFSVVRTSERVLIVVSELDNAGVPELKPFYTILEALTGSLASTNLAFAYREIKILRNSNATFSAFKSAVRQYANRSEIKAIDFILAVHGNVGRVLFADGRRYMSYLYNDLYSGFSGTEIINSKRKLRMFYNTACYGQSHLNAFIGIGFDAANGSVGVNANSEFEFMPALTAWRIGAGFKSSYGPSNTAAALWAADEPVRVIGRQADNSLQFTDSKKIFAGNTALRIDSDPQ